MSNFSDIGFYISSEQQLRDLVEKVYPKSYERKTPNGTYFQYRDPSGAEIWIQVNQKREIIGVNPHYNGKSKRKVRLTSTIERKDSILDGAYHCWSVDSLEDGSVYELFPFVFDVPDYDSRQAVVFPSILEIQLVAFASQASLFDDEKHFEASQEDDFKWAAKSFIPTGLFNMNESVNDLKAVNANAILSGKVVEYERKYNEQSGKGFYWILLDTLGGLVDLVADLDCFKESPTVGAIIHGQFWLTGRLEAFKTIERKEKGFFSRLFS